MMIWENKLKHLLNYLKSAEDRSNQEQYFIEYTRSHLANYKCPKSISFVDDLPRSDAGKLVKRCLK